MALGPMVMLEEGDRPTSLLLNGGTSTSFTAAWTRAQVAPYVPAGARALYLNVAIRLNGNAALDQAILYVRRTGDTTAIGVATEVARTGYTNIGTNLDVDSGCMVTALCNSDGRVDYAVSNTGGEAFINVHGYYL